jgi:hypothetical protein
MADQTRTTGRCHPPYHCFCFELMPTPQGDPALDTQCTCQCGSMTCIGAIILSTGEQDWTWRDIELSKHWLAHDTNLRE